jgi:hypothetical protein
MLSLTHTAAPRSVVLRAQPEKRAASSSRVPGVEQKELVFLLERRGSGWAEEVLPHLTMVHRSVAEKREEVGGVQLLLREAGVSAETSGDIVARATAWRVRLALKRLNAASFSSPRALTCAPPRPPARQATSGGRQLLDKRKQRAVQRNAGAVLAAISGGLPAAQLQALLQQWPGLLQLDASQEWERQFCRLAVRLHAARSAGAAPEPPPPAAAAWEEEQREAARLGVLLPARAALMDGVCFDWGLVDREWEARFDELVAWRLQAGHADVLAPRAPGAPGVEGPLADWARRQLALHRLGTLPAAAAQRLRLLAFPLPPTDAELAATAMEQAAALEEEQAQQEHAAAQASPAPARSTPRRRGAVEKSSRSTRMLPATATTAGR